MFLHIFLDIDAQKFLWMDADLGLHFTIQNLLATANLIGVYCALGHILSVFAKHILLWWFSCHRRDACPLGTSQCRWRSLLFEGIGSTVNICKRCCFPFDNSSYLWLNLPWDPCRIAFRVLRISNDMNSVCLLWIHLLIIFWYLSRYILSLPSNPCLLQAFLIVCHPLSVCLPVWKF